MEERTVTFIMRNKRGKVAGLPPRGKARTRQGRSPRVALERMPSARKLQRTLYRTAKGQPDRRFTSLYDKIYRKDVLEEAYRRVKSNGGAAGVDKVDFAEIETYGRERFLEELKDELLRTTYRANKVRRVYIPKPGQPGRQRPLGIPTVKDRVVQMATKLIIEPLFEADFQSCSYGFRPKRTPRQALSRIAGSLNAGYEHVVDVDLRSYFDTINHDRLMGLVERRVGDVRVLRLIRAWLKAGILDEGEVKSPTRGTPQGGVISPLLSNIFLHEVDLCWSVESNSKVPGDIRLVRYADDMVLLARTGREAKRAWRKLQGQFKSLDLEVNEEKSQLTQVSEGFAFLGFEFRTRHGRLYMWPRSKAVKHIGERIRQMIHSMPPHVTTLWELVRKLNRVLNGWCTYFRVGNSNRVFHKVDWMVRDTVQLWLRRKHRIPWRQAKGRWNFNVLHNLVGLYRMVGKVSHLEGLRAC
jgi:RNA-directed DNA polymerase